MTQKFSTGAFVFTRTRGLEPRDSADLQPVAVQHGIDSAFIPTYPGDRVTIMRATTHASRGLANEGFLLRPIRRTSSEVIYGDIFEGGNLVFGVIDGTRWPPHGGRDAREKGRQQLHADRVNPPERVDELVLESRN